MTRAAQLSHSLADDREVTMLRLKPRQREAVIEKLPDLANIIAGALIFGQFVAGQPFSSGWR